VGLPSPTPTAPPSILLPPAGGFAENSSVTTLGPTPTPIASVIVAPRKTGKFIVTATAVGTNGDTSAAHSFTLGIGRGSTVDYTQPTGVRLMAQSGSPPSQQAYAQSNSIAVEYGSTAVPNTFPVGVPVTFVLFALADSSQVFINAHQAQMTVQEVS
jgi:hypothetical protein